MTKEVLLDTSDYAALRFESRGALRKLGVQSNPGFTNRNIIEGLAHAMGKECDFPDEGDISDYSGEIFRDSLGELLGLDVPPMISEVVTGLR